MTRLRMIQYLAINTQKYGYLKSPDGLLMQLTETVTIINTLKTQTVGLELENNCATARMRP